MGNGIPLNGGNAFSVSKYLKAISNIDTEQWRLYLLQRNYFSNEIIVKGDEELENIWTLITTKLCDLGQVLLSDASGEMCVYTVSDCKTKQNGEIIKAEGYKVFSEWSYNTDDLGAKVKGFNGKNAVLLNFNSTKLPLWYLAEPLIATQITYLTANKTNAISSIAKKFKITAQNKDSEVLTEELGALTNPGVSHIINIVNPTSYFGNNTLAAGYETLDSSDIVQPNKIEELNPGPANLIEGWDAFDKALGFWNTAMGRVSKTNSPSKKERIIVGEVDSANTEMQILQNNRLREYKKFAYLFNKTFGKNITVEFLVDIKQEASGNIDANKKEKEVVKDEGN